MFMSSLSKTGTCKGIWITTRVMAGNMREFTSKKDRPLMFWIDPLV